MKKMPQVVLTGSTLNTHLCKSLQQSKCIYDILEEIIQLLPFEVINFIPWSIFFPIKFCSSFEQMVVSQAKRSTIPRNIWVGDPIGWDKIPTLTTDVSLLSMNFAFIAFIEVLLLFLLITVLRNSISIIQGHVQIKNFKSPFWNHVKSFQFLSTQIASVVFNLALIWSELQIQRISC